MNDTIIEQLAEVLWVAHASEKAKPWPEIISEHPVTHGAWRAMATECLRQMTWTQREARAESRRLITQQHDGEHLFVNVENILFCQDKLWSCPLTLAPPDWLP